MYKLTTTWSGGHWEAHAVPVRPRRTDPATGIRNPTSEAAQALNDNSSRRQLRRLLESNFPPEDIFATLTYRPEDEPLNYDAAAKILKAYIKTFRTVCRLCGISYDYIYVIEGRHGDKRIHHHIVCHAAAYRIALALWPYGIVHAETILQFAKKSYGPGAAAISLTALSEKAGGDYRKARAEFWQEAYWKLASYLTKEPRKTGRPYPGLRAYTPSVGLRKPEETVEYLVNLPPNLDPPEGVIQTGASKTDSLGGAVLYATGWSSKRNKAVPF